jgi:hypothetical protein
MTDPERDFSDEPTIDERDDGPETPQPAKCPACGHEEPYHCGAIDCPRPERPRT